MPLSEEEIQRIKELSKDESLSDGQIAKAVGHHPSTICRLFQKLGIVRNGSQYCAPKKAIAAKVNYDRARRLDLNNKWFIKIEEQLDKAQDSKTLRELATPYGVAEDKRHLLEPQGANPSGSETPKDSGFSKSYLKRAKEVYAHGQANTKDQSPPI